ncbi:MAG: hypothetical protein WAP35_02710, partial [Solirubrobacterales bacterium]
GFGDPPRRIRPRRAVLAVAALLVLISIPTYVLTRDATQLRALSTGEALAVVADATLEAPAPRGNQFLYTRGENSFQAGYGSGGRDPLGRPVREFSKLLRTRFDSWISPGRCGLSRQEQIGEPTYPTERDRIRAERMEESERIYRERINRKRRAAGKQPLPAFPDLFGENGASVMQVPKTVRQATHVGGEKLSRRELRKFPTEPRAIYNRIKRSTSVSEGRSPSGVRGGRSPDFRVWNAVVSTLAFGTQDLPRELRAGMIRTLGIIPGVRSLGEVDSQGRKGTGFSRSNSGQLVTIVFDQETGIAISSRAELAAPGRGRHEGWPVGTVIHEFVLFERKLVDDLPPDLKPTVKVGGFGDCGK